MIRATAAGNAGRGERQADGPPDPAPGARWDLDLLTPDDVCALLKVKKSWLYDTVEDGSIETIRLGKQLRFRPSAILRYLEERAINVNGRRRWPSSDEPECRRLGSQCLGSDSRFEGEQRCRAAASTPIA